MAKNSCGGSGIQVQYKERNRQTIKACERGRNEEGQVYQSYRYNVTGEITFGAPQYENEYTYNGESYNPNIQSQYLRARYYCVVTATFLTEDSYLGNQTEPLTLNRYNYCVSSYLNYTDPSGNSFENASDKILAGYRKIDSLGHELIIAVNSFSSGVSGSISKSNMDKMAGVIAVGEMLERMFGIRVRSGKPAYEQYTDLTETLVQKLSKDATNRTMYYAGRCAGDALVMATGAMEIAEGLNSFFSGIGGTVVADASGVACVASGATIAITLDGVVTIVDGAYTIYNGVVAIQGDSRQYRDAKGADRKASESGSTSNYYNPDGSPIWPPNRGFDGNPTKVTLEPGTLIDRYGYDGGTFVSPKGIPYTERSLPIGTDQKPYTVFEVVKPVEVQAGKIAPWFGEKGGGIQYEFSQKISDLLQQGILRKVQN